jgi:hypothetical protein
LLPHLRFNLDISLQGPNNNICQESRFSRQDLIWRLWNTSTELSVQGHLLGMMQIRIPFQTLMSVSTSLYFIISADTLWRIAPVLTCSFACKQGFNQIASGQRSLHDARAPDRQQLSHSRARVSVFRALLLVSEYNQFELIKIK